MKTKLTPILGILFSLVFIFSGCSDSTTKTGTEASDAEEGKEEAAVTQGRSFAGPPTIIYKTREDYSQYVPVSMSEDKTEISSFPGIKDVYYKGKLAYPAELHDGFLLDNRGIDQNVAFLKITYEEYSQMSKLPSTEEMMELILDNDPITEMFNCGSRYQFKNLEEDLNSIIDNDQFNNCKKLK